MCKGRLEGAFLILWPLDLQVPSAYMPAMPAIPALNQRVPSLSHRSSYHDLPTLHLSGDRAMDREARVMRCAACRCPVAQCVGDAQVSLAFCL